MLPTLDDLKKHLNMTRNDDDAELLDILDAAVDVVEGIVGPVNTVPITETHRGLRSRELVLRRMPVAALTAVSSRVGATITLLSLTDFELDADTGIVRFVAGYGFYGDYTVTYTTGRSTVPAAIGLATLIIAAHLWETQRGVSPTALQQLDPSQSFTPGAGYAIPNRAQELLQPYTRPAIA